MNINQLLSTFEQRLRLQRYSEASIRNYKSAVGSFLQLASKKYDKPEDLTAKDIEKYVYWLIQTKNISASYQRMVVASIDKFYNLTLNIHLPIKHLYPTRKERSGGMFLLPISKHCHIKLHESLLDAETLKYPLSRQLNIPHVTNWAFFFFKRHTIIIINQFCHS